MSKFLPLCLLTCIALSLSACGHYQQLQGSYDTAKNKTNRYSQTSSAILSAHDTEKVNTTTSHTSSPSINNHQTQKISKLKLAPKMNTPKKFKSAKPSELKLNKFKSSSTKNKSLWQKFLFVFTPEKVKPWQKATLAKASMKPGGLNPDSEKFNQKIYSSKESSRGGLGVSGGGCGCN